MKKIFTVFFMVVLLGSMVFCQSQADSPQTVIWDDVLSDIGVITYEVYLVSMEMVDRSDIGAFYFLGVTVLPEKLIDVGVEGLEGDFFVGVRTAREYSSEITYSGMAYSDVEADVDIVGGTFFLRYLKGLSKPQRIRIK